MIIDQLAEQIGSIAARLQHLPGSDTGLLPAQGSAIAELCAELRVVEERLKAQEAAGRQTETELAARVQQQAAVSALGLSALARRDLQALMDDAARIVTETLQVEFCKILELLPGRDALLLRAGVGWRPGMVGETIIAGGPASQAGYTLAASEPVVVTDLRTDSRFIAPKLLHDHGVISGLSVIIHGRERPFGVLGAHTTRRRVFTQDDVHFLQAAANTLAAAIERRRSDEELRRSRDELAIILRGVGDGITVQEPSGRLVFANEAATRLIGFESVESLVATSPTEVLARFDVFDESGNAVALSALPGRRALQGETVLETMLRFRIRATGEERWSVVNATPVFDDAGQVLLAVNIFHDVTQRMQYEETLRFQAEASTLLSESLDYTTTLANLAKLAVPYLADWCIVAMLQPDGNLRQLAAAHSDPQKAQLLAELQEHYRFDPNADYGAARVIRTGRSELYSDISDAVLAAAFPDPEHFRLFRQLGFRSAMIVPLSVRGQCLGTISCMSAESGRRFAEDNLALAEDLARRAALAIDQARLYREAQEAVQLRDQFLSIAAHELKTPVTALMGYTQVLQRRAARVESADERDQRALAVIVTQSERLARLIGMLLDISRIQTGYFAVEQTLIDLSALLRRVVDEILPVLHKHTLIHSGIDESLMLYGDESRLEQVFQNLVQNAVKYSPEGGLITVSVEHDDACVSVSVSDEGIGIPKAAQERLFQRFYRADNAHAANIGGMGIGLYVVKEIVIRHGGTVSVQSSEGQGSTFVIRLPLTPVIENSGHPGENSP